VIARSFSRLIDAVEAHARWVLALWLLAAVALTLIAPSLNDVGSTDTADFLPADAPSQQADRVLARLFPDDPTRESSIVVFARDGGLTDADEAYIGELTATLTTGELGQDITDVQSTATSPELAAFLRAPDGEAELLVASMADAPFSTSGTAAVERLRDHLEETAPDGLTHHVTGIGGLAADQANGVIESFDRTAIVTVLLVLVILFAIYRSAVAALIPLLTIGLAFGVSNGLVAYTAQAGLKVNTMVGTFMVVMVFGAGTDYCLFLTSRYREELHAGDPVAATVKRTTLIIGAVIAASAATVIVGFSSMISADFGIFKTMGPAIGIAIAVTLVAGLTLTPALLRLAGTRAFWPRTLEEIRAEPEAIPERWHRLADTIRRWPSHALLGSIIVLQIPAAGLGWYSQSFNLVTDLPAGDDSRAGFETVEDHYPGGVISPVYLAITANGPILDGERLAAIDRLTDALRTEPGLGQVRSITQPAGEPLTTDNLAELTGGITDPAALGFDQNTDLGPLMAALDSPGGLRITGEIIDQYPGLVDLLGLLLGNDGNTTRLIIALEGNPYDNTALDAFERIDEATADALAGTALTGAEIHVGGPSSFYADMREISNADFRIIVAVILGAIFVVLALLLRSLVAPFYLLASVVLSYAATMGITVAVFQGLFGAEGITFWLAPFLFVILVALGADYNIFIMSRIREEADAGHEIHDAVSRGLTLTGRVITSAGLILAGTFAALLIAPLPNLQQIGFGVTVGILIDTFLVRSIMVPAATMLLGRWAFWPFIPGATPAQLAATRRPRHIGLAGAATAALAVALLATVLAGDTDEPIGVVAAGATATGDPSTVQAATQAAAAPTTTSPAPPDAATTAPGAPETTTPPPSPTTSATTPAPEPEPAAPSGPGTRIAAPAEGTWAFHATGSQQIGVSTSNIDEQSPTTVTRTGGTDDAPELRVRTETSSYTRDDTRRHTAAGVELLATTFSAQGATFGGPLDPPQLLAKTPLQVGATWSGRSSTDGMTIDATARITRERDVTVPAGTFHCWEIQIDATITGDIDGEQHDTSCWVPDLGLPVITDQKMNGTYSGIDFRIDLHFELTATP
jgi:RND superfamily putative drug exporter